MLHLLVRVQPKASQDGFAGIQDGRLRVRITAPPVDGKANACLLRFIAKACGVNQAAVQLKRGETGRNKHLCITAPRNLPEGIVKEG